MAKKFLGAVYGCSKCKHGGKKRRSAAGRRDKIMTTRIAGGLLLGYNPRVPGQGLKPLA